MILKNNKLQNNQNQTIFDEKKYETGIILGFASNNIPNNWFICNGAELSRETYSVLFNKIGTSWGVGNNTTTFNLPDLRGFFIRGRLGSASSERDTRANNRIALNNGNINNHVGSYHNYLTARPTQIAYGVTSSVAGYHRHGYVGEIKYFDADYSGGDRVYRSYTNGPDYWGYTGSSTMAHYHDCYFDTGGDLESCPPNIYLNFIIRYR